MWKHARSIALLIAALASIRMSLGYLIVPNTFDRPPALSYLETLAPLWSYGALWTISTVLLILSAFLKRDTLALALFTALNTLWFISYVWDFILSAIGPMDTSRAWFTALIYLVWALYAIILVPKISNPYARESI